MLVEVLQLLSERQIVHPSRIVSSTIAAGEFQLSIEGHPWWRHSPSQDEGRIIFRFSGVTEGELHLTTLLDDDNEALEGFEISLTSELDWAQPDQFSIYCSMPLPRPLVMYTAVEDYLITSRASRTTADFLNGATSLNRFLQITSSRGYQLATGPASIRDLVVRELDAQSIRHTVINTTGRSKGRLFVRLGCSGFFCEAALAEFE
jgi:hypothetical protein